MSDLALVFNQAINQYDVAMSGGDLLLDESFKTAVLLSLLLDRPALPGDELPDPRGTDRRGFWIDPFLPPLPDGRPDFYGSRLWLLRRALQIPATLVRARDYAFEALEWALLDGAVGSLDVQCSFPSLGWMNISPIFSKQGSKGVYDVLWSLS